MRRRVFSALLAAAMVLQLVGTTAFATNVSEPSPMSESKSLSNIWVVDRENSNKWRFAQDGTEKIEIQAVDSNLWYNQNTTVNLFRTKATASDPLNYTATVRIDGMVEPSPTTGYQQVGMMIHGDDDNFVQIAYKAHDGKVMMATETGMALTELQNGVQLPEGESYYLKLVRSGDKVQGFVSADANEWTLVGEAENRTLGNETNIAFFTCSGNASNWIGFSEVTLDGKTLPLFSDESEPPVEITALEEVRLDTKIGVIPALPESVTATYSNGKTGIVAVTWDSEITQEQVSQENTLRIEGTVADTSLKAVAVVNVKDMPLFDETEWTEDPETFVIGAEDYVANFTAYQSEEAALTFSEENSDYYQCLDGTWKFHFAMNPSLCARAFQGVDFDDSGWDDIPVPASWSNLRNDDGSLKYDHPIYCNMDTAWRGNDQPNPAGSVAPSYVNSVGSYRTVFTVKDCMKGKEIFLNFDGVESAYYVWVNGKQVGYAENTFGKHVFRITDYLNEGENVLAVQVYKWCDGSLQEYQDMLYYGGIFRSVYLTAKNEKAELHDFELVTDLDETYTDSTLELYGVVRTFSENVPENMELHAKLLDAAGEKIAEFSTPVTDFKDNRAEIELKTEIENPNKWTAETPYLYDLVLTLTGGGETLETTAVKVGFREIEVKDQGTVNAKMYLNGKDFYIKGVNRQELNEITGRAVTKEQMEAEFKLMKQYNINALRMSHYPESSYVYDLCDKYGIMVMSEANVETHGAQAAVSGNPAWGPAVLDRVVSMFEQHKNHSCVVIWSVGNEQGAYNINKAAYYKLKELDRSGRVVSYDQDQEHSDLLSYGYRLPSELPGYAGRGKPFLMLEYGHAMGNSVGNLQELWDVIEDPKYPSLQGGFVWDWVDQGLSSPVKFIKNAVNGDPTEYIVTGELMTGEFSSKTNPDRAMRGYAILNGTEDVNLSNGFTFEAKIMPDVNTGRNMALISKGNSAELRLENNFTLRFTVGAKSITYTIPTEHLKDSRWHDVAATFDGGNLKLYYDGAEVASGSGATLSANNAAVAVGSNAQNVTWTAFYGRIDNAHVYTRALSAAELSQERTADDRGAALWFDMDGDGIGTTGEVYFAYGGDWMDFANQSNFCVNGMLLPDKTIQSELYEVKQVYQNAVIALADAENTVISVTNKHIFTDLNAYTMHWELKENQNKLQEGNLSVSAAPGETVTVDVPVQNYEKKDGSEYWLEVSFQLKEDTLWAEKGHVVITKQLLLQQAGIAERVDITTLDPLTVQESASAYTIEGTGFAVTIDRKSGEITSFKSGALELLEQGPIPNYFRAPVDNDRGASSLYDQMTPWRNAGTGRTVSSVTCTTDKDSHMATVAVSGQLPVGTSRFSMTYYIYGDGTVQVDSTLIPEGIGDNIIPVVGTMLRLPKEFSNVTWYGKGPFDTTSDRKTAAKVGLYETTVEDMFFPHLRPQEAGGRDDIRWMALTNNQGQGLLVSSLTPFSGSALEYTPWELADTIHPYQLEKEDNIVLRVDALQMGVGGAHSWGSWPIEEYLIRAGKSYSYSYFLSPITDFDVEAAMTASRTNYEMSVEQVAANITYLSNPAFSDEMLTLPAVPEGFSIAIKSSSHPQVINLDGKIYLPAEETKVTLVLTVRKESDGSTADTIPLTVTVAARPPYYPWEIIREEPSSWKYVDDNSDAISIKQTQGSHWDGGDVRGHNLFVVEPNASNPDNYTVTVKMTGVTTTGYEQAGLIIYKDDGNFVQVARMHKAGRPLLAMNNRSGNGGTVDVPGSISVYDQETVYLKIEKTGSTFKGYASADGITWDPIGTCTNTALESARVGVFSSSEEANDWFTFENFKVDNRKISFRYTETNLSDAWRILRENSDGWSIPDANKNQLVLYPMGGTLEGIDFGNSQNVFLTAGPQGEETAEYRTTVKITGLPKTEDEAAGLVFYSTDDRFLSVSRTVIDGENYISFISEDNGVPHEVKVPDPGKETIYISLSRNRMPIDSYTARYSLDGEAWIDVGTQQNTAVYGNEIGVLTDGAISNISYTFEDFYLNDTLIPFTSQTITPQIYTVTVEVNGQGIASADPTTAEPNTTIKLMQEADEGWHFVEWQSDDVTVKDDSFTMPAANVTVTAVFEKDEHVHTLTKTEAKEATCTEDGNTAYWYCEGCQKYFSDEKAEVEITQEETVVKALGHDFAETWTNDKSGHWHVCTRCDAIDEVLPHIPGPEATETEPQVCTECGYVLVPSTGHVEHTPSTEWSYDENQHWHKCTGCEEKLDVADHSGGTATCTEQAVCEVCGQPYGERNAHSYTEWKFDDAQHWKVCADCGAEEPESRTDHGWKLESESETEQHYTCVCGAAKTEEIPVVTWTVTFEANNGSKPVIVEVKDGETVTAPDAPTNGDFDFDGWYTNAACTEPYDFNTAVTENITLYAGWKMVGPSVDHDNDKDEPEEPEEPEEPADPEEPGTDIEDPDTPLNPAPDFTDVADDFWGKEAIDYVVAEGLMNGTSETTFAPNVTTTRAMLMTILARMDGVDTTGSDPWYQKGMEWAIAEGVSDGTNPEGTITREQLAVMLYRYSDSPEVSDDALTFSDADAVSDWAVDGVRWAVSNGILSGKGNNTLDPQGNATRAEVAQMLYNFSKIDA